MSVESDIEKAVKAIIQNSPTQFTKLFNRGDIEAFTENLIEIASYNLNKIHGLQRDSNLNDPWVVIYGSKHDRNQIEAFYVKVESFSETFLSSTEYLFEAVDLVKMLIDKVTAAIENYS